MQKRNFIAGLLILHFGFVGTVAAGAEFQSVRLLNAAKQGELWLASQQTITGSWESSKHVAITAMVLAGCRSQDNETAKSEEAVRSRKGVAPYF